jgi:hypothetical protein
MPPDKITDSNDNEYTHADTGTAPSSGEDFTTGEKVDSGLFDWQWSVLFSTVNALVDWATSIDSTDNGKADVAETAESVDASDIQGTVGQADNATRVNGNVIDSDGDGVVDRADVADETGGIRTRTSDPPNPKDGDVWIRSDL